MPPCRTIGFSYFPGKCPDARRRTSCGSSADDRSGWRSPSSRSPSSPPPVAAAAGEARSAELGNQIDQQLTADMATIPLYAKPTYLAVRDRFTNVGDNATQEGPFWNSGRWAQKAA
jgi:ABC-type transport system substrate-binding protein